MRQTLKQQDYFEYAIDESSSYIKELEGHIATNNPVVVDWAYVYRELFSQQLKLFFLKYTLGHSKEELRELALAAIQNYITSENHPTGNPEALRLYIGLYSDSLKLTSLAILYDAKDLLIDLKTSFEKNKKGNDLVLEVFFTKVMDDNTVSSKLCYPKIYTDLAGLSQSEDHETIIKNYLDGWYEKMKKTEWYNLHKKSKVNGATPFYGYWSMEAAALVKIFNLDISLFEEYEYFPKDLLI
ncbi:MAG: PoNe immunity protein domain-containing protein [Bacteroidota bacterium]